MRKDGALRADCVPPAWIRNGRGIDLKIFTGETPALPGYLHQIDRDDHAGICAARK
jgi:hypothetical protein